jgi:hypothetical protein
MKKVFAALAVLLLLIACDKELPENKLSEKEILVRVRMVGIAEGKEADLSRSASMQEPERVAIPVGDGVVMEMKMEQDKEALRANKAALDDDSYFRIIAVKAGTSEYVSHDDFTINGGSSGGLHVPDNNSYDFICYSYNSISALPALSKSYKRGDNILDTEVLNASQSTNDLLWQKKASISVNGSAPELEIELGRVMARVKVVVNCEYNDWIITNIANTMTLGSTNSGGTIRLTDKTVVSSTGTPTVTWPTLSGTNQVEESNPVLVMPKGSGTLTVNVPVGAISRLSSTAIPSSTVTTGTFSTALVAGNSYKLYVKLRVPKFAGSNIYYDGTTGLVFDPYLTTTHEGYQGLMFRWGSLVGIAVRVNEGQADVVGSWNASTTIYVPNGNGWKSTTATAEGYTKWRNTSQGSAEIPYVDASYGIVDLTAPAQNTSTRWNSRRGDICQYIGAKNTALAGYRMPILGEFGPDGNNSINKNGWTVTGLTSAITTVVDGTYDFVANNRRRAKNTTLNGAVGGVVFPVSGYRYHDSGEMKVVNSLGVYAMATPPSANTMYELSIRLESGVTSLFTQHTNDACYRAYGLPVRCVLAD